MVLAPCWSLAIKYAAGHKKITAFFKKLATHQIKPSLEPQQYS